MEHVMIDRSAGASPAKSQSRRASRRPPHDLVNACARACAVIAALALSTCPALSQAGGDGPFSALAGGWSGEGTITMSSGARERIRCQATYRLESRTKVDLRLSCSSDSYRFELQSDTIAFGQTLSGTWTELTRRVSGQVTGQASGERIDLRAESQTFSALLTMTTRGSRQAVSIRSPGSEMSEVSISLTRRPK
jgi:hypothetical protein